MRYLILLLLFACTNKEQPVKDVEANDPLDHEDNIVHPGKKCEWKEKSRGKLVYDKIKETSGACFNGESLFIFDDSGNPSRVHTSKDFISFNSIDIPFKNKDWEAIDCNKNNFTIFDIGKNNWNKDNITLIRCEYNGFNCNESKYYYPTIGKDAESALMYETGEFFIMEKLYDMKNPSIYTLDYNDKLKKAYVLDWSKIGGIMRIASDMALSPSENKFAIVEIDNPITKKVTWFECFDDLRIEFNHNCEKHQSMSLGQVEAITYLSENEILFTTEGSSPVYYIMSCE